MYVLSRAWQLMSSQELQHMHTFISIFKLLTDGWIYKTDTLTVAIMPGQGHHYLTATLPKSCLIFALFYFPLINSRDYYYKRNLIKYISIKCFVIYQDSLLFFTEIIASYLFCVIAKMMDVYFSKNPGNEKYLIHVCHKCCHPVLRWIHVCQLYHLSTYAWIIDLH